LKSVRRRKVIALGIVPLLLVGAASVRADSLPRRPDGPVLSLEGRRHLAEIDVSDGISPAEAWVIAEEYFYDLLMSCGSIEAIKRRGRKWIFNVALGMVPRKSSETITVDARTGGVSSTDGPAYRDLADFIAGNSEPPRRKPAAARGGSPAP
jgi:hypothetical protein